MAGSLDLAKARAECLDRILATNSRRQVIVAGPGTGKTYTFKRLLQKVSGDCLAITFLNALANDMSEELGDLADTRTFHSFCRKLLHWIPSDGITADFYLFPKLEQIVARDALAFGNSDGSESGYYGHAFHALIEDDGRIDFFLERASFYNAVGFDDSVYRILREFRNDSQMIPAYDQVVVDEYQDFNPLEVEFITHLESKSPIMIVGDDDQAIYDFKAASPRYLRQKAADSSFERHDLPYCSRCTSVVVEACNGFIKEAVRQGKLQGRIDKEYRCYTPDKETDSKKYPQLIHAHCSVNTKRAPYIARYIEGIARSVSDDDIQASIKERYPLALIIGPSHYLQQIYLYLAERFENVVYKQRQSAEVTLFDAYRILLNDESANLGWRIITWLENSAASDELLLTTTEQGTDLYRHLDPDQRAEHLANLEPLRAIMNGHSIGHDATSALEKRLGLTIEQLVSELVVNLEDEADDPEASTKVSDEHPEIWLTTYNGCKGMSAGFTFVVGLEDGVLPRMPEKVIENEIRQFVVALTRTRKECHLISTGRFGALQCRPSIFLKWVPDTCITVVRVDKNYF